MFLAKGRALLDMLTHEVEDTRSMLVSLEDVLQSA